MAGLSVLIVEDETPIRDALVSLFSGQDFEATHARTGAEALAALGAKAFDLVVLDLMIPPPTGIEVLTTLREKDDRTPVLVLTALGTEDDVVRGLEAGADDYLTKPFGVKELLARARGLLRRVQPSSSHSAVERLEHQLAKRDTRLTAREADLLGYLMERNGRTIARDELLVGVWGYRDGSIQTRTVDVHVQQLRAKLASIGGRDWITTVRGRGYVFDAKREP